MFEDQTTKTDALSISFPASAQNQPDPDYLYRRAEQELELAQAATHPAVVKAHYLLADHYLEALHGDAAEMDPGAKSVENERA